MTVVQNDVMVMEEEKVVNRSDSDDSDDIENEISKLEQTMDQDEDTDEDANQEEPDFAPHESKRKGSLNRADSGGLGANAALRKGPQLIAQTEEDVQDQTNDETVDDDTFEVEAEGLDGYGQAPQSERRSLQKEKPGDIEMHQISRGMRSPVKKKKLTDIVEICQ